MINQKFLMIIFLAGNISFFAVSNEEELEFIEELRLKVQGYHAKFEQEKNPKNYSLYSVYSTILKSIEKDQSGLALELPVEHEHSNLPFKARMMSDIKKDRTKFMRVLLGEDQDIEYQKVLLWCMQCLQRVECAYYLVKSGNSGNGAFIPGIQPPLDLEMISELTGVRK